MSAGEAPAEARPRIRRELRFGLALMGLIVAGATYVLASAPAITRGHLGLLMLALVVVAIMLGFPTAFTLMGMGIVFTWLAYDGNVNNTLNLMVQSTFKVMNSDVLIAIPLFVFMGYLVERANLIEKLFRSLHLAMARVPGSLAVATLVTCTVFSTATGIVGAVVTLMGLLAFPTMLKAGYNAKLGAGAIAAGGCLGILIPPSVMLIVYGATAGVSVVQLYAGAFFPGLMLAGLYVVAVMVLAWLRPDLAPPLRPEQRRVDLPAFAAGLVARGRRIALPALIGALRGGSVADGSRRQAWGQFGVAVIPLLSVLLVLGLVWNSVTSPADRLVVQAVGAAVGEPPGAATDLAEPAGPGVSEPPSAPAVAEPPGPGVSEPPPAAALAEPPLGGGPVSPAAPAVAEPPGSAASPATEPATALAAPPGSAGAAGATARPQRLATPAGFWIACLACGVLLAGFYATFSFERLEIFKMLLASFFPLVILIVSVLGSIVFGLATPTEAAAVGAFGGFVLAALYMLVQKFPGRMRPRILVGVVLAAPLLVSVGWRLAELEGAVAVAVPDGLGWFSMACVLAWGVYAWREVGMTPVVRESVYLTGKTTAMVCWLFVGSAIFSAAFALLGGQELVERWVLGLNLSRIEFLVLSQVIIFLLGWPLEWTEIIVIFMPIFIPLLDHFGVDPLFFGLLVALNLQTAFLSPPVAMAAFYLKGVAPPHVTLNQIFAGMLPFMAIQVLAIVILYVFPEIGLWLPKVLYGN